MPRWIRSVEDRHRETPRGAAGRRDRGQSLVELAITLPILLLLTLIALDFGRLYLGWINLQNMARIAANQAANAPQAWTGVGDPVEQQRYRTLVLNDARATNCDLDPPGPVDTVPNPTFPAGTTLGSFAQVGLRCNFSVITPGISAIVGQRVAVSATATFPIKSGAVADIPVGGGGTSNVPVADFSGAPTGGTAPLVVQFTDLSANAPVTWTWNFGDGGGSNAQNPTHTYQNAGTYTVSLVATNAAGSNTRTRSAYIVVSAAPGVGPTPEFTATPTSGNAPLAVSFTDQSTGSPTSWAWDFDGNGTTDSTSRNPNHTYSTAGTYTVRLTVSNAFGTNTNTKVAYISVNVQTCLVPNFAGVRRNSAQAIATGAGFTTPLVFQSGNGNYEIGNQIPQGGQTFPCTTQITVGP